MRAEREHKSKEREQAEAAAGLARDAAGEDIEMVATGDGIEQAILEPMEPICNTVSQDLQQPTKPIEVNDAL